MTDSKYFAIPFGTSGDRTPIPEPSQSSGAVSYTQGFGPDYERISTDPLVKRVPRNETNDFYYQVSLALKYLQLYGHPEWYSVDDSGNPVSYAQGAVVRRTVAGVTTSWVSVANTNTATPGSDPTKWVPWNPSDVQTGTYSYAVATGTANALTATFAPAISSPPDGTTVRVKASATNTGAATLNGAAIQLETGAALAGGEIVSGRVYTLQRNGSIWVLVSVAAAAAALANTQNLIGNPLFRVNQAGFAGGAVAAGQYAIDMWGAPAGVASNMSFSGIVATIASGNMKQVVEDPGSALGLTTLSWVGTSTASVNGGSASTSPITFNHTGGNISVVFGAGTVSKPMMAQGSSQLPFIAPSLVLDQLACYRYYYVNTDQLDQYVPSNAVSPLALGLRYYVAYPVTMRIQAAITLTAYTLVDRASGTPSPRNDYSGFTMRVDVNAGNGIAGVANLRYIADARFAL